MATIGDRMTGTGIQKNEYDGVDPFRGVLLSRFILAHGGWMSGLARKRSCNWFWTQTPKWHLFELSRAIIG